MTARVCGGSRPKLTTVLVGDDPASVQYVELKTEECGGSVSSRRIIACRRKRAPRLLNLVVVLMQTNPSAILCNNPRLDRSILWPESF